MKLTEKQANIISFAVAAVAIPLTLMEIVTSKIEWVWIAFVFAIAGLAIGFFAKTYQK